jgi:predicted oxidoreductase
VLLFLLAPLTKARAQDACPWLTRGTAAALIHGDVSASVHVAAGEGTCEFTRDAQADHQGGVFGNNLQMKIKVSHVLPKVCASGERVTGIGQDAVSCSSDVGGVHQELIQGRVRARYFLLALTGSSTATTAVRRHLLEMAAEEVAGNLF